MLTKGDIVVMTNGKRALVWSTTNDMRRVCILPLTKQGNADKRGYVWRYGCTLIATGERLNEADIARLSNDAYNNRYGCI